MANTSIRFKIGETDYSNRVVSGTYKVQNYEIYTSWKDGNKREHRHLDRY